MELTTLCLLGCALATGQSPPHPEWLLMPRLARGQELVYRGSFTEEVRGPGVQFQRAYRLETRAFVLDTPARGYDVAFLTVLKARTTQPGHVEDSSPGSVRLEIGRVDLQGRISTDPGTNMVAPLEGPATIECEAFVEVPRGRVAPGQTWQAAEAGRPSRTWKIVGTEAVGGTSYLKLEGIQQSDDWDHPRADHTAWRRQDVVWLVPKLGVAFRVERTLERREPAHNEPSQRSVARYELESSLQYPGQLFEDRRREIFQARVFHETALPLLPNPGKYPAKSFDAVLAKIKTHLDSQPPTPYRDAILQVRRRVEAGKRGEAPPTLPADDDPVPTSVAAFGQRAPDFAATDLTTRKSVRLSQHFGKPILLVFYSPSSLTAEEVLRFAQGLAAAHRDLQVLGCAVTDDAEAVKKQHDALGLSFAILAGKGLRLTFSVDATPKLIVLDASGVVRANYVGWGPETPGGVAEEVKRWLRK
jgi:peroxiredoxin